MKKGIRRYFIILIVIIVCIVTLVDCTNTQTRQEERTSASHLIINWENEVQIFDADAIEMEGAAIAQVCELDKVPFVIIRGISDSPNGNNKVTFEQYLQKASKRCAIIIEKML